MKNFKKLFFKKNEMKQKYSITKMKKIKKKKYKAKRERENLHHLNQNWIA